MPLGGYDIPVAGKNRPSGCRGLRYEACPTVTGLSTRGGMPPRSMWTAAPFQPNWQGHFRRYGMSGSNRGVRQQKDTPGLSQARAICVR